MKVILIAQLKEAEIHMGQHWYKKMLEVSNCFTDNGKSMNSYCVAEGNDKNYFCSFYQENHIDAKHKMIYDIVPDDGPLGPNSTQHTNKEELRIFQNATWQY